MSKRAQNGKMQLKASRCPGGQAQCPAGSDAHTDGPACRKQARAPGFAFTVILKYVSHAGGVLRLRGALGLADLVGVVSTGFCEEGHGKALRPCCHLSPAPPPPEGGVPCLSSRQLGPRAGAGLAAFTVVDHLVLRAERDGENRREHTVTLGSSRRGVLLLEAGFFEEEHGRDEGP